MLLQAISPARFTNQLAPVGIERVLPVVQVPFPLLLERVTP
jgi:hypothetical protein